MSITIQNSWWNDGGLWQDPDLMKVKSSLLYYRPTPFDPEVCQQPAVLTLRGPRRVGKTVSLKLLVASLIEQQGWQARDILWTTLDTFRRLDQVEKHLTDLMKQYKPRVLFVDEVTTVVGWQRVIKKLRDTGVLSSVCIILTGSSAYDLKSGAERMAGRRGDVLNSDRVLLPMSFQEFCKQLEHAQISISPEHRVQVYLEVGGFPFRVEKYIETVKTQSWDFQIGLQIFDDVFFYEFVRRKLDRNIALEILERLAAIECSAISYESFVKPLTLAKETARKYLDALGDAFLLTTLSSYDTSRDRVAPKKDRKFCWVDPALGFLGAWLKQADKACEASRAEWTVGVELLRRYESRLWEGLSSPCNLFTWKSSGGNEIDYLVVDKSRKFLFPVEVKYQQSISDWDLQVMERAFGRGWLITPSTDKLREKTQVMTLERFLARSQIQQFVR